MKLNSKPKLEPFMKPNSKRSETESGTQPRSIRDQNDPCGSKLEPFMKLNSKNVAKPNLECNYAAYAKMIEYRRRNQKSIIGSKLEPAIHETNRGDLVVTINASRLLAKTTWLRSVVARFRSVTTRFHSGNHPV